MFTALILACNYTFTECRSYMYPALFTKEELCILSIQEGIVQVESLGLFVKDYKCVRWDSDT